MLNKLYRGGCKRFMSGHGIAGMVSGIEAATIAVMNLSWYGGVLVGPTLDSACYRYTNTMATPASAGHRKGNTCVFPILCTVMSVFEILSTRPFRLRNATTTFKWWDQGFKCGNGL